MTSPLAVIGLTYDGTDLQTSDLSVFLQIVRGLNEPPSVRGVDVVVPGRAGRIEGNRINDILVIQLEGIVRSTPTNTTQAQAYASFRSNVQAVRSLFAPDRLRAPLVATLEDGSQVSVSARPMPGIIWTEPLRSEVATVAIELEADGDWGAVSTTITPSPLALTLTTFAPVVS